LERIVLYRNLSAIPRMVLELRAASADLVVIQSTLEPGYFKMHILAATFGSQAWVVFDDRGSVRGAGGLFTKIETITRSLFGNTSLVRGLIVGAFHVGRTLARIIAAPVVALGLLIGAARYSLVRYRY